jgi:hypothetical protein
VWSLLNDKMSSRNQSCVMFESIHQILSFEADFNRIGQREFFENFRKTVLDFESYYTLNTLGNLSLFIKGLKLNLV